MIKMNFPYKLQYKIEKTKLGIFSLGSDNGPIITIYDGRGIYLQYRFIPKVTRVEETFQQGKLTEDEITAIEDEIEDKTSKLCVEANIRHYVRFVDGSPCYYDFRDNQLYGAEGVRPKTGPINGESFHLRGNARCFVETMTEVPGAPVNANDILEDNKCKIDSFDSIWSAFRGLDPSIHSTFVNLGGGICTYRGNAQTWQIVGEAEAEEFTLDTIFSGIAYRNIVAIFDRERGIFHASLREDIALESILAFLGLDDDAFRPSVVDIEKLIQKNYYGSAGRLEDLLKKYTGILESVWNHLAKKIENNLDYTFRAASRYGETGEIPERDSDLESYKIKRYSERWNNALERACQWVTSMLQSTCAGVEFFAHCEKEVNANNVIKYISAFILICFSNCKTSTEGEEAARIKAQYRKKLLELIRQKFGYIPPAGGQNSIFGPLQEGIQKLLGVREQLKSKGIYEEAAEIEEIVNELKLSYGDENSLCPPTMGRDR